MQIIDRNNEPRVPGVSRRPWSESDQGIDAMVADVTVRNVLNAPALYLPLYSSLEYLRGKNRPVDSVRFPLGLWYRSLVIRNMLVDGVRRDDGKSHTDGIYISEAAPQPQNLTIDGYTIRNTDGSCMPILLQPVNLETLTLRNVVMESSVAQKRVVLKPGVKIKTLRVEHCHGFVINEPAGCPGAVQRIELLDSTVDVEGFRRLGGTEIVTITPPAIPAPAPAVPACPCVQLLRQMHTLLGQWLEAR